MASLWSVTQVTAFSAHPQTMARRTTLPPLTARKLRVMEKTATCIDTTDLRESSSSSFDPFGFANDSMMHQRRPLSCQRDSVHDDFNNANDSNPLRNTKKIALASTALSLSVLSRPQDALAGTMKFTPPGGMPDMANPQNFQPVCPASDGFYRFLQGSTEAVVGRENFVEYGPLIAGGLLRIRLELCVIESFFNEAVGPFIQQNGLRWILPLHETVETFLAGTIFSLASTFILVGSTKLVSVIVTYADVFLGVPSRVLGGFFFDRARGKPVTLDIGFGPFKTRVIGPPDDDGKNGGVDGSGDGDKLIDFENTSPVEVAVILFSGAVKIVGDVLKVRAGFC